MAKGFRTTAFGLALGICAGLGVLYLKHSLGLGLIDALQGEAKSSCSCHLEYDSISLSLLTQHGRVNNIRLVEDGVTKLVFKRLDAYFSLREVLNHKVWVDLILTSGHSEGVGPESATFKFIDYLGLPVPPERDRPDRWRVKLRSLAVRESTFTEDLGSSRLEGNDLALEMARNSDNDFRLRPRIGELHYVDRSTTPPSDTSLGSVAADFAIKDTHIAFETLKLIRGRSAVNFTGITKQKERGALDGKLTANVDSGSLELPPSIGFDLTGEGVVGGRLAEPQGRASFRLAEGKKFTAGSPGAPLLSFDSLQGESQFSVKDGTTKVSIQSLDGKGSGAAAHITTPVTLQGGALNGGISISLSQLGIQGVQANNINAILSVHGTASAPALSIVGSAESVTLGGRKTPPVNFDIQRNEKGNVQLSINSSTTSGATVGSLKLTGAMIVSGRTTPILDGGSLLLDGLPLSDANGKVLGRLSGSVKLSGPISQSALEGSGLVTLVPETKEGSSDFLSGNVLLSKGQLSLSLSNSANSIQGTFRSSLTGDRNGELSLNLLDYRFKELLSPTSCLLAKGTLQYKFSLDNPDAGSGKLSLQKLEIGCYPHMVSMQRAQELPIAAGKFTLQNFVLSGDETSFKVEGPVSIGDGLNIKGTGTIQLHSLASILPSVDDIHGTISTNASITGSFSEPSFAGNAEIKGGQLTIEQAGVSAEKIAGQLELQGHSIQFNSLTGSLNGGQFSVVGDMDLINSADSAFHASFTDVQISPQDNLSAITSGELDIGRGEGGKPLLSGTVNITNAELQQNIVLNNFLQALAKYLLLRSKDVSTSTKSNGSLPAVDLDIALDAPRNVFVITPWAAAELGGSLKVKGTLENPTIDGTVSALSGWFSIKDHEFDINSGTLTFKPGVQEPALQLLAETSVRSRTGENVLIMLEATGRLTAPKLSVRSDRGLSEREIFDLIASRGSASERTLANRGERGLAYEDSEDESLPLFSRIFNGLTKIDRLSLEPTYDPLTGVIEPTIVARKQLLGQLALIGESSFGTQDARSRLKLVYNLTRHLNAIGYAESSSSRNSAIIGADATYTVLAEQASLLEISIKGNSNLSSEAIMRGIRLTENSVIPPESVPDLGRRVSEFYRTQGYLDTTAEAVCTNSDRVCHSLKINISEGPLSKISHVVVDGQIPLPSEQVTALISVEPGEPATAQLALRLEKRITHALRSEGYISARVSTEYGAAESSSRRILTVQVSPGNPVSFVFNGNKKFSAEEFLETINLFGRKQPFGNNTINILIQNIDRMYREAGYLFATVSYERVESADRSRVSYLVTINEEREVPASGVTLEGNGSLAIEALKKLTKQIFPEDYRDLWKPKFAVEERATELDGILMAIYGESGFPATSVTHRFDPAPNGDSVEIVYVISEGTGVSAKNFSVVGVPTGVTLPKTPEAPYSIPKANRFIQELGDNLRDHGFLKSEITANLNSETSTITINAECGELSHIGKILVLGNSAIPTERILSSIGVVTGDPWDIRKIDEGKRRLFGLGLFSKVEVTPTDGALDQPLEDLLITVVERPLDTLEVGTGANSEFGVHLFGEAVDRAIFKDGRSLSLRVDAFYDSPTADISQGVANLRYSAPYVFASDYTFNQDLRYQKLDLSTQEFNLNRISLASYFYRPADDGFSYSFGHTIAQDNLDNVSTDVILSHLDEGLVRLSFISGTVGFDRRDDPLLPQRGANFLLDWKLSSRAIGSDADFAATLAKVSGIQPLPISRFSLAASASAGGAWSWGTTDQIPITQRFYLGGRNTVRGFRENSLGARGVDGGVIGGDVLLAGNLELRYLAYDNMSADLFFDAGNVFLQSETSDFFDLRKSVGVGIRYLSPIGPIGFDIGHPLDEKPGEPSVRFHFNIGTNF